MRVGIIGAGVAGLSAGHELTKRGHEAVLYEAGPRVGGLAAGFRAEHWDWHLEQFYHHLFTSDDTIINLVHEIGMTDRFFVKTPVTGSYRDGHIYALDNPLAVLRFPLIPFVDRLRLGLVALYLKLQPNWQGLESATAHEWLQRYMGRRAYEAVFEPMFIGKFGDYYTEIPMSWFWARIHKRTRSLGYFEGGFQAFVDTLGDRVRDQGGTIHLSTPVTAITPQYGEQLRVSTAGGDEDFDAVIATVAPSLLMRMVPELPNEYLAELRALKSLGAVVMVLALDRPLTDGAYWIDLDSRKHPFLLLVEHTNFVSPEHYGGDHLVYLGDYLPPSHRYFDMDADELLEVFRPTLSVVNPDFDPAWVKRKWLFKATYAQPVVPLNYSRHIPELETPIPGLYFASMSQVYPWDRGTNYAVEIGQRVARRAIAGTGDEVGIASAGTPSIGNQER
jgi:protoporphyrinogen oxidase